VEEFLTPAFWFAVGQIIMIDILLGGDNAVVIALACRQLPDHQRTKGIMWGTAGAIILRVILIFFALTLLAIPFLKFVGAVLLIWIGVKLLTPDAEDDHSNIQGSDKLWGAVKTVIIADLVMSVDNVIAIAGAAQTSGNAFGHLRFAGQHPHHRLGQPAGPQADGPFPDDHHRRWHAAGLDRGYHDSDRSWPGGLSASRQSLGLWLGHCRCFVGVGFGQNHHGASFYLSRSGLTRQRPLPLWARPLSFLEFGCRMDYHRHPITREQMPCKKGNKV